VNWGIGHWDLTAAQNYQRSYEDIPGNAGDLPVPRTVSAYMTHDLQASYTGLPKLRPSFGVRNVFDEDPPYTNAGGSNFFQAGYDPGYADPRGRFYYATVTFSFGT
jgi:iron complex outermembrane receptor protein